MITEDYVSFEIAKLLKEKGFNEPCECAYSAGGQYLLSCYKGVASRRIKNDEALDFSYSSTSPTLQMVMKWLREMYQIDIQVFRHIRGKRITFYARIEQNTHLEHQDHCNLYQFYEQACEAAIKYCLKNLI